MSGQCRVQGASVTQTPPTTRILYGSSFGSGVQLDLRVVSFSHPKL